MRRESRTATCLYLGGRRMYREALQTAMSKFGIRLVLVGSVGQAVDRLRQEHADGALIDVDGMDEEQAAATVAALLRAAPGLKVGGISDVCRPELPAAFVRAGACGFLSKESPLGELRDALERMLAGDLVVDPAVARSLFVFLDADTAQAATKCHGVPHLTGVEQRVLSLAAEGRVNKQIARELDLSPLTVKNHLARVRARFEASTTTQAVAVALRAGLLE